jgi:hypothetical protein
MAHRAKRPGSLGYATLPRWLAYPRDDLRDSLLTPRVGEIV